MKKKIMLSILGFLAIFLCLSPVCADMGPKPSVVINISGVEGQKYYVTLLSKDSESGPFSVFDKSSSSDDLKKNDTVLKKFINYEDKDKYFFLQYFLDCSNSSRFDWTYFPPDSFKILFYFPDIDYFVVSDETFERYAFDSYYRVEINGANKDMTMKVTSNILYTEQGQSLFIRVLITLFIEIFVAFGFGFKSKKQLMFIILTNILTQIILNIMLGTMDSAMHMFVSYFLGEAVVFLVEIMIYKKVLINSDKSNVGRIYGYTVTANFLSLIIGFVIKI